MISSFLWPCTHISPARSPGCLLFIVNCFLLGENALSGPPLGLYKLLQLLENTTTNFKGTYHCLIFTNSALWTELV